MLGSNLELYALRPQQFESGLQSKVCLVLGTEQNFSFAFVSIICPIFFLTKQVLQDSSTRMQATARRTTVKCGVENLLALRQ